MDAYAASLVVGAAGLAAMGITGLGRHGHAHGGHAGHGHGHGAHSHSHGPAHPGHSSHSGAPAHGHNAAGSHHHGVRDSAARSALTLMSPRVLFAVLLGLGTTGVALHSVLGGPVLFVAAVAGGIFLERALVAPLWSAAMRFASEPAHTLESAIEDEATAVTGFDVNGQGLVAIELDGQVVQILGTLRPADRELGVSVRAGARVRIETVDEIRNSCVVSAL